MADWNPDDTGPAPPDTQSDLTPTMPEIQRRAAASRATTGDAALDAIGPAPAEPKSPLNTSYAQVPTRDLPGEVAHGLGLGARDVIEGVAGLPTALADAGTWIPRALIRAGGGTATAPSDMLEHALDWTGLPNPETEGERTRSTLDRGGAAMLGPLGLGAAKPLLEMGVPLARPLAGPAAPITLPGAATQVAAGGAGAEAGDLAASSDLVPPWLKPTARMVGNIGGAGAVSMLSGAVGTLNNAIQGVKTPIAEALDRLGIVPKTAASVTERPGTQAVEGGATRLPFSSGVLQPAQRDTINQFRDAVERTASDLGPEATKAEAGGSVQQILQDWHGNTFPKEQAAIWQPIGQRMAGASVDPAGLRGSLESMARPPEMGSMAASQQAFASPQAVKWLDALNKDFPPGHNMSWEQAMAWKQRIGSAMGTPQIVQDVGMDGLNGMYRGLAGGMRDAAEAHGQLGPFLRANQDTVDTHNFIQNTLGKAITTKNPGQEKIDPDQAATAMLNSNSAMQALRDRVPQAADALAAYQLRQAANAKPSQQGAGETTSTGTFLTTMRGQQLNRPEGTAALYSDPKAAQSLNDLLDVAAKLRETERLQNLSGTSGATQVATFVPRLAAAGYYGGIPAMATMAAADAAPYGIAKYLTSPTAIRLASTPSGPRAPIDSRVAGLLGYLANQPSN